MFVLTIHSLENADGVGNLEITRFKLPSWTLCTSLSPPRHLPIWLLTLQSSLISKLPTTLRTPSRTPEVTRSSPRNGFLKSLCTLLLPPIPSIRFLRLNFQLTNNVLTKSVHSASLVLVHGIGEHSDRYMPFVDHLLSRSIAVYTHDHESTLFHQSLV